MKFDKRIVAFEDTNWFVIEISTRNITSNRKLGSERKKFEIRRKNCSFEDENRPVG